jgi:hypothetical protein
LTSPDNAWENVGWVRECTGLLPTVDIQMSDLSVIRADLM